MYSVYWFIEMLRKLVCELQLHDNLNLNQTVKEENIMLRLYHIYYDQPVFHDTSYQTFFRVIGN